MAGGFKKFLSVIGFGEEEDEELLAEEPERVPVATPRQERRATAASSDYTPGSLASQRKVSPTANRVYAVPQNTQGMDALRMMVLQPQSFEDTQMVIDNLLGGKSVVLNLENLKSDAAQRVLDFVSGAIYALNGNIRKVSKGIFILAPQGVDISGNISASFASSIRKPDFHSARRYD